MQEQHLSQFKRGVRIAHRPAAFGVAAAEVLGHDRIEHAARNDLTGSQPGGEIAFDTVRFSLFELGKEGAAAPVAEGRGVPAWVWVAVASGVALVAFLVLR